jgi:hypothetical protein
MDLSELGLIFLLFSFQVGRERERDMRLVGPGIPSHMNPHSGPGVGPKQRSFITFGFNQIGASSSSSPSRPSVNVNVEGVAPAQGGDTPEIRKYKKR